MPSDPQQTYRLFFAPGEVTEIRAIGLSGKSRLWDGFARGAAGEDAVVFGYFDNPADFARTAQALEAAAAPGVYFTPNPVHPDHFQRAPNLLVTKAKKRPATSDHHIQAVRWLLVDFDSDHAVGVSATEAEMAPTLECAKACAGWLRELGFAEPIKALSGNGYHLNYRIEEIPPAVFTSKEYKEDSLVRRCLHAISARLQAEHPRVKFDLSVFNPARIWKLYGTTARKGFASAERPHRRSFVFSDAPSEFAQVPVTPLAVLERLAGAAKGRAEGGRKDVAAGSRSHKEDTPGAPVPAQRGRPAKNTERMNPQPGLGKLKVQEWLAAFGRELHSVDDQGVMVRYNLRECVFNPEHMARDAAVLQDTDGKLYYHCSHNSCRGYTFADARKVISGDEKLTKWMEGYDPDWKPPDTCGSGILGELELAPTHVEVGCPQLPDPVAIDPMEFFTVRGNGGRPAFVVQAMANYLAAYLAPLVCTDGVFWRYSDGCWRRLHDDVLRQMVAQALKDRVQADWIKSSLQVLSALVNRLETQWQRRPYMINLLNGVVDLEPLIRDPAAQVDLDTLLRPHAPELDCRSQLPVEFDPAAECNRWIKAMWEVFPEGRDCAESGKNCAGDDKVAVLQQFGGYLLLPTCKYERAAFLVGPGANGKSTVINTFISVLGKENTVEMSLDDLARSFNVPYLQDKLLVTCAEMTTREPTALSILKKCISGDPVAGEWKYKQRIEFWPTAKFIFALNEVPTIVDKSYGFARKILIIKFDQRFDTEKQDVDLFDKLREERNGIFLWMLQGACDLIRNRRFAERGIVRDEKDSFLQEMNPFLMWAAERTMMHEGASSAGDHLYKDYSTWMEQSGQAKGTLGKIKFYHSLTNNFGNVKRDKVVEKETGQRRWGFAGIALRGI